MLGVIANVAAVLAGSTIGLICKRGIPKRVADAIMMAIGICTVYIGVSGMMKGQNQLVAIISMVLGAAVGTLLDIDRWLNRLGEMVEARFRKPGAAGATVAEGFVTASLLFCIGAMTIVGSLNAGLTGDNQMLYTKSVLDFISSIMLSASLGVGVMCSAAFVLVFQGGIVLLAGVLAPILSETAILELTCVGSLLIFALGLNLMSITKIKVANLLPAVFFAPVVVWAMSLLGW